MSTEQAANKTVGIRTLMISVMMSMLVSVVVFTICSMAFIFPQMSVQDLRMVAMQKNVAALSQRIAAVEGGGAAPTAAAEQPAAPEGAPAPEAAAAAAAAPSAPPAEGQK